MVMVGHETVGMTDPVLPFGSMPDCVQEVLPVGIVPENGLLLVPARRYVVDSTGVLYTERTSHNGATVSRLKSIVKLQDVTL